MVQITDALCCSRQSLILYSLCCFWVIGSGIASYSLISILTSLCSLQTLDADLKVVRIGKALLKLFRYHVINIPSSEDKTTVQKRGFSRSSPDSKLPTQVLCNKMSKTRVAGLAPQYILPSYHSMVSLV